MGFFAEAAAAARPVFEGLGEPCEYRSRDGGAPVTGIFAIIELPGESVRIQGLRTVLDRPQLQLLIEDVPMLAEGDAVHAAGRIWQIEGAPEISDDRAAWIAGVNDVGPVP